MLFRSVTSSILCARMVCTSGSVPPSRTELRVRNSAKLNMASDASAPLMVLHHVLGTGGESNVNYRAAPLTVEMAG